MTSFMDFQILQVALAHLKKSMLWVMTPPLERPRDVNWGIRILEHLVLRLIKNVDKPLNPKG